MLIDVTLYGTGGERIASGKVDSDKLAEASIVRHKGILYRYNGPTTSGSYTSFKFQEAGEIVELTEF